MGNVFCYACSCQEQDEITMREAESTQQIDELIVYIDRLTSRIEMRSREEVGRPNSVASSIIAGGNILEKLSKHLTWNVFKKCLLSALDHQTRKVVIEVLNQANPMECVRIALSIIVHLLEREASSNEGESLQNLRYMAALAKHMRNLNIYLERGKLGDILRFIVKAAVICSLQMETEFFCRFIFARLDAVDLENLKTRLVYFYPDLEHQALTEVLNRLPTAPGPSQGEYPQDSAAGMGKAEDEVIKLLDLTESSRRVVVIYGIGGIGKTTLATAVIKRLVLRDYNFCRVDMDQDCKQSGLQLKQEQILRDLFKENLKLNSLTEGREKLREALGNSFKPVFLFIDNALRQTDLEMLLPVEHLSCLPMRTRILVTTRNLNETNILLLNDDIQFHCHRVDPVSEQEAKRILCQYALNDIEGNFDPGVDIDSLLHICGGIPLLLRIVGSKLRTEGNTESACNDMVEYLQDWQQIGFAGEEEHIRGKEKQEGFEANEEQTGLEGKQEQTVFESIGSKGKGKLKGFEGEEQEVFEGEEGLSTSKNIDTLNRESIIPGPAASGSSPGEYCQDAVGIEEAQNEVIELLDLTESSVRVVVIYGISGIGKTTLANAVVNRLNLTGYHYCKVDMDQDSKQTDILVKQEQILSDLFEEYRRLDNCTYGRETLSEAFRKPVFLFIDNVLRQPDLNALLPVNDLSLLPMQSRILVTTRNLEDSKLFELQDGIQFFAHTVDSLSEPDAKRLLSHYVLGNKNIRFDADVDIDGLLQFCGGIPFVLRIVGSILRTGRNSKSTCNEIVEHLKEWQQTRLGERIEGLSESMVDFVYRRLREHSKEAFLDIAFFFNNWERSKVSDIIGEMELRELEEAALVTTSEEDVCNWEERIGSGKRTVVKMHDIVRARGRKLSEGNRIIDRESLVDLLGDDQKIQQIKGIWIGNHDKELIVEAKQLDFMSKVLRVLSLGNHVKLHGPCNRAFEELRFLQISYEDILSIDPRKSKHLAFFHADFNHIANHILPLPESLRLLHLNRRYYFFGSLKIDANLTLLTELELTGIDFDHFETATHGHLSCLKMLKLKYANLKGLPESFGNLSSLQTLSMDGCSRLERLPESFGNLSSLQTLVMDGCFNLGRLPDSFGNLSSLQTLSVDGRFNLERLPESFGNLSSLQTLSMYGCSNLERLPESFGNLSSLQTLSMYRCSDLKRLPKSFGNLSSLKTLSMYGSSNLEKLPESFGNLSSLQKLFMSDCEKMCSLPNNFGQLKCLKYLSIRNCKKLQRLPDDIVCLSMLAAMKAYGCVELEAKAMDSLVEITSLMFLEMGESPMLIKRWEEIHNHRPLIAAALRFESYGYPSAEIMSTMFFSGESKFLQVDGDGQLAEVASSPDVGVKVALLLTAWPLSHELIRRLLDVAREGFQIIHVDVDVEGEGEGSRWMEEREKRITMMLMSLPEGSHAWTSPFSKAKLLFAYSLWEATGRVDESIFGTSVVVDEEGRRKLSHPFQMIFQRVGGDSRGVELRTRFSPLSEAREWMLVDSFVVPRRWETSVISRSPELGITSEGSEPSESLLSSRRSDFSSTDELSEEWKSASHEAADWDKKWEMIKVCYKPKPKWWKPSRWKPFKASGAEEAMAVNRFELGEHEEIKVKTDQSRIRR